MIVIHDGPKDQGNKPTLDNPIIIDNDVKPVLYMLVEEIKKLKKTRSRTRLAQNLQDKMDCSLTVNRAILEVVRDLKIISQQPMGRVYKKICYYEKETIKAIKNIEKSNLCK